MLSRRRTVCTATLRYRRRRRAARRSWPDSATSPGPTDIDQNRVHGFVNWRASWGVVSVRGLGEGPGRRRRRGCARLNMHADYLEVSLHLFRTGVLENGRSSSQPQKDHWNAELKTVALKPAARQATTRLRTNSTKVAIIVVAV